MALDKDILFPWTGERSDEMSADEFKESKWVNQIQGCGLHYCKPPCGKNPCEALESPFGKPAAEGDWLKLFQHIYDKMGDDFQAQEPEHYAGLEQMVSHSINEQFAARERLRKAGGILGQLPGGLGEILAEPTPCCSPTRPAYDKRVDEAFDQPRSGIVSVLQAAEEKIRNLEKRLVTKARIIEALECELDHCRRCHQA